MLYRLNAAINRFDSLLIVHTTELYACTGPVPRPLVDDLVRAVEDVVRIARAEPAPASAVDEPALPMLDGKAA